MDLPSCSPASSVSEYWLILHLLVSFSLVANVRWSRIVIHNHACNSREVPACCCRKKPHQVTPWDNTEARNRREKKLELVEKTNGDAKTDKLSLPALALSFETARADARLKSLRTEYATYLQMLKVGLPRVIVDHKLRAENKDPSVLDELIRTTSHVKRIPAPIQIPPMEDLVGNNDLEHKQKVESFRRMIKVGVPRHVVELKARKEGVNLAELDAPSRSGSGVVLKCVVDDTRLLTHADLTSRSRRSSVSSIVSTAPSTPDALAARSASIISSKNGRDLATMALRKMNNGTRKKLHWSTTPYTGTVVLAQHRHSLWSHIHVKAPQDGVCISNESRRWMEKLFVKVVAKAKAVRRHSAASQKEDAFFQKQSLTQYLEDMDTRERANSSDPIFSDDDDLDNMESEPELSESGFEQNKTTSPGSAFLRRKMCVVLLDHKKSQNIAIVLARVKRTFPELTRQILTLDCDVLSSPALQSLIDMWPDSAEQEAIDSFDGDVSSLATVSAVQF
uniref:FH2 domain-containing protein n=1 Tax=Hyaloperonospora arabidopsidis (strain Emoy2) TaxID=559515 RepID=M4BHR5_HYAAE